MAALKKASKARTVKGKTIKGNTLATAGTAAAIHLEHKDGVHHLVGLGNIRVVIVRDGKALFAQGLEIDYAAQGSTLAEVKKHFEDGLDATIQQHLKIYGDIKQLLKPAPAEVWLELLPDKEALHKSYWHISEHTIQHSALPYDGIKYLVADKIAA
jgi:hypothetical protein